MQGIKGWLHIYLPTVEEVDNTLIGWAVPVALLGLSGFILSVYNTLKYPSRSGDGKDNVASYVPLYLVIYIIHREIGLQVTYSYPDITSELPFFEYYIILAVIDMAVFFTWLYLNNKNVFKDFARMIKDLAIADNFSSLSRPPRKDNQIMS